MRTMAPWDAIGYFNQPKITTVTAAFSAASPLCEYNPNRVGLIISNTSGAGTTFVAPASGITASGPGILLSSSNPSLLLDQQTWGPLVSQAWYVGPGTAIITVIELILNKWPEERDENIRHLLMPNEPRSESDGG